MAVVVAVVVVMDGAAGCQRAWSRCVISDMESAGSVAIALATHQQTHAPRSSH